MRTFAVLAAAGVAVFACSRDQEPPAADADAQPIAVANAGFATPESMLHDPVADVYLVSNINGNPVEQDDNGFISRLGPDGTVLALKWIDGATETVTLNAPKGLAIKGDTLFVADVTAIRWFDRTTGAPLGSREVAGASFLNDVAVGADGTVYFTDTGIRFGAAGMEETGTDAVYRLTGDSAVAVAQGPDLGRPNGLTPDSAGLLVVTFGSGAIYRLDPLTGQRTDLPGPPQGQLDGVVRLTDGSILVSSWAASRIFQMGQGGATMVGDSVPSPADIGLDAGRSRVLIPVFNENRVVIQPVQGGRR
jgi:sugar lactone lactonase YvrE